MAESDGQSGIRLLIKSVGPATCLTFRLKENALRGRHGQAGAIGAVRADGGEGGVRWTQWTVALVYCVAPSWSRSKGYVVFWDAGGPCRPDVSVGPAVHRMRALELRIPPLALVLIFAVSMAAVACTVPASLAVPARVTVAVALAFAGAVVALAGVVAFRRQKTTVNPFTPDQSSALVASGIYRFSRNPMYLGFLLGLLGWAVYLANWGSALLLPGFVAYMNRFQIKPEERALEARFGQAFVAYARSVRRWL